MEEPQAAVKASLTGCGASAAEKDLGILVDKLNMNYKIILRVVKENFSFHNCDIVVVAPTVQKALENWRGFRSH